MLDNIGKVWLRKNNACEAGYKWASTRCQNLDEVWKTAKPEWLLWLATRPGTLSDKDLRLFAVYCARQVQHLMKDQRSINAVNVAEKFALGEASKEELNAACAAAWAAWAAAWDAARAAAWAAASDAAGYAAWDAARDAAGAAWAAARAAAGEAAGEAEQEKQAAWLRVNTKPSW